MRRIAPPGAWKAAAKETMPITVTETRTEERIVKFGDPGPCVSGGNKLNGSKNGVGVPGVNPKVFAPNVDHIWAKVKVASKFQKSLLQWLEWPIEWPPNESDESPVRCRALLCSSP